MRLLLGCGALAVAACAGDAAQIPGGGAVGPNGSGLPDGGVLDADGSVVALDGATAGPDGDAQTAPTLEPGFVRLGITGGGTVSDVAWRLRVYGSGSYLQPKGTQGACGVPELHEGCVVDTCDARAGTADASAGAPWSGVVTIVDETRDLTVVTDLATLGVSTSAGIGQSLPGLVGALAGDVLHLTAQNVPGFPAIDVRLTVPTTATIAFGPGPVSGTQGTPFASVVAPGTLRLDLLQDTRNGTTRAAFCFFDRTLGQHMLPPIESLALVCDESKASLYVTPVGMARAIVGTAGQDQALVYVVQADQAVSNAALTCSP